MNYKIKLSTFLLILLISCRHLEEPVSYPSPLSKINIKYNNLQTTYFNLSPQKHSINSTPLLFNKQIICPDKTTGQLHIYDLKGNYLTSKLGYGKSIRELPNYDITGVGIDKNNINLLVFSDLQYYIYDTTFTLCSQGLVQTHVKEESNLNGNNPNIYSWAHRNFDTKMLNDKIYYSSTLRRIDPFDNNEKYFREGRTIMSIDGRTGQPLDVYARYSQLYNTNKNLFSFSNASFDFDDENNCYVSFEADSLIYKFDKNFKAIATYGYSGRNINMNYAQIQPSEDLYFEISQERINKGYYLQLFWITDKAFLARVYYKGADAIHSGLQLYDNNTLIANFDIPKYYRIIGYDNNCLYFAYSDIENQTNKIMTMLLP